MPLAPSPPFTLVCSSGALALGSRGVRLVRVLVPAVLAEAARQAALQVEVVLAVVDHGCVAWVGAAKSRNLVMPDPLSRTLVLVCALALGFAY